MRVLFHSCTIFLAFVIANAWCDLGLLSEEGWRELFFTTMPTIAYLSDFLVVFGTAYACISIYTLPIGIALHRRHDNVLPIALLTFFGAWTGILWVLALVWSVTRE